MTTLTMTDIGTQDEREEAMISIAQNAAVARKGVGEPVGYYRAPKVKPDGTPHDQAGWIQIFDQGEAASMRRLARRYIPLQQYGRIEPSLKGQPENAVDLYGRYGPILSRADGVAEFPVSQIIAHNWYAESSLRSSCHGQIPPGLKVRASDGMVLWPQLKGVKLRVYACKECNRTPFNEPILLARHLRTWHDYDRTDIERFGEEEGIDWNASSVTGRKTNREYIFGDDDLDETPSAVAEDDGFETIEAVTATRGK